MTYRDIYGKCSLYLEKLIGASLETNVLKGIGTTGKAVGKFIGSIPVVKEATVDEFLQENSLKLKKNTISMEKEVIESFAKISNPGTRVFLEKMDEMIRIYNHTTEICFDEKQIYLVTD